MRSGLSIGLAAVLLMCSGIAAQETDELTIRPGAMELGAFGLLSMPVADYGDLATTSGGAGILFGYYPSSKFAFGVEAGGHWHGATDEAIEAQKAVTGASDADMSFRLYRLFTPYAKYLFKEGGLSPYAEFLTGFYLQELKVTASGISSTFSQGYFGVAGGLGVQYNSPESVALFFDARFHEAMRDGSMPLTLVDIRVGAAFLL